MGKTEDKQLFPDIVSSQQIVERFKTLFGRDMTPQERKALLLPDATTSAEEGR